MAVILNIDTSASHCSVAVAIDGEIAQGFESAEKMDHSSSLAPFIEKCLDFLKEKKLDPDAVSVASGPGSYTGLRIGMSMAKGIAFGKDIPLITISSLEVMAVRAIFTDPEFMGDELIVPMIDARRMEVYTGVYDSALNLRIEEHSKILDENSFEELIDEKKIIFIGDGTEKFKPIYKGGNAKWLGLGMPHAKYMAALSEIYYKEKRFSDVAYTVPSYLKEYQTTKPKSSVLKSK